MATVKISQLPPTPLPLLGADLVSVVQGGTTSKTTLDAVRQYVTTSVKNFGAVGDGVTDDTAAIQAAFNFVKNSHTVSRLFFPNGTYLVSSTLSYTQAVVDRSIAIEGEDEIDTIIKYTGINDCLSFSLGQNNNQVANRLEVKRISIKTSVAGAGAAIRSVRVASGVVAPNALFEDVYVYQESGGYWQYGIRTSDASDQWFNRCYLMHYGPNTTACVLMDNNLTSQSVFGAYFYGCSFNGATNCLKITGQIESVYVNNCVMAGALDVIYLDAAGTTYGNPHLTVAGSHLNCKRTSIFTNKWRTVFITGTDVYSGVGVDDVGGNNLFMQEAQHVCVTGSKFEMGAIAQSRSFMTLSNVDDFSVTGNVMENATAAGIIIVGTSARGVISGNTINGCADGTPNNEAIYNTASGNSFVYSGNYINYFNKGILVNASNNVIVGNAFNNLSLAVEVVGGADNYAKGNTFRSVTTETTGTVHREIFRSVTVDPPNVPNATTVTQLVTVPGAVLGNFIDFAAPYDVLNLQITSNVQNTNTVALYFRNDTGSAVNLPSGTWNFRVHS